ncbi:MAG TPA: hypothetical protein VFF12_07580 [Myxococcaceae bacterium]|nr:hypothetical protein [Myxococcaceae bacterium]
MAGTVSRMLVLAVLAGCAARETPPPPPSAPPPVVSARSEPVPPAQSDGDGGCRTDADCGKGQVCVSCGKESSCVGGCRTSADCPPGEVCAPVACIRCPCPSLCGKQ